MNREITPEDESLVREVCLDILSKDVRGDTISPRELARDERLQDEFDASPERPRIVGHILSNAEWATVWSGYRYVIEDVRDDE